MGPGRGGRGGAWVAMEAGARRPAGVSAGLVAEVGAGQATASHVGLRRGSRLANQPHGRGPAGLWEAGYGRLQVPRGGGTPAGDGCTGRAHTCTGACWSCNAPGLTAQLLAVWWRWLAGWLALGSCELQCRGLLQLLAACVARDRWCLSQPPLAASSPQVWLLPASPAPSNCSACRPPACLHACPPCPLLPPSCVGCVPTHPRRPL